MSCEAHGSAVPDDGIYHAIASSNKDSSNHGGVYHSFISAGEQNNGTGDFSLKYGATNTSVLSTPASGRCPTATPL